MKELIYKLFTYIELLYFNIAIYYYSSKSIYFIDIDNTLADTYPTLSQNFPSECYRYQHIPSFQNLCALSNKINNSSSRKCIFISARPINYFFVTKNWLKFHTKIENPTLFLVGEPEDKLSFYKTALSVKKRVTVIDDLSHNHEKGNTLFYEEIINQLKSLSLRYIGYSTISQFNNK